MRLVIVFLTALFSAGVAAAVGGAQPAQTPTVKNILSHMIAKRQGLNSFIVPVHFDVKIRNIITVPVSLDGIRYYEIPDREALVMKTVPALAQQFQKIFVGLGTPETWPNRYNITLVPLDAANNLSLYELQGKPKAGGNVDHILLDISKSTYEPVKVRWFYKNGATIVLDVLNAKADKYLLPKTEIIDIAFPAYMASATATYGTYAINQPIPDSVWEPVPSPSP